jgi:hypothetical protein
VVEAKAMWKGPAMDLLRQVYEETQHQDRIEACGYRSATWRILRELKSINGAKMMAGESAITAAPFFESADGYLVQGNPKDKGKQAFLEHSRCIFMGRCKDSKRERDSRAETSGGKHVARARSWWKRGDVSEFAAQTNMECWVHQDIILDDDKAHQSVKEAWGHEDDKDELEIELQGLERQFWLRTEEGRLG